MRFMVIMKATQDSEAGVMPEEKMLAEMGRYNEELVKAGIMLAGEGLHPSSKGARISFAAGKASVTDGPFTEARELIGGYWMWQVKSKEEAVEWAKRCPALPGDTIELRQVFDAADFGPEIAAREAEFTKALEKNRQS